MRLLLAPVATAESVPVEQGQTTMAEGAPEPEATGAIQSSRPKQRIWPGRAPVRSVSASASRSGRAGSSSSVSVAITRWAALEIITQARCSAATSASIRRRPYWAPEAPVRATVTGSRSALASR